MESTVQKDGDAHRKLHNGIINAQKHINGAIDRFLAKENRLEDEQRVLYALNIFVHYLHEDTIGDALPKLINNLYTKRCVEEDIQERGTVQDIGLW